MVTIPQTELGFGCGGWSALRRTIFVAFGDQLHHSFWISKQRHPLFTVCTGYHALEIIGGPWHVLMFPERFPRSDEPSMTSPHMQTLLGIFEGRNPLTIQNYHANPQVYLPILCPYSLSLSFSLDMIFNGKVQTTQCPDFAQSPPPILIIPFSTFWC